MFGCSSQLLTYYAVALVNFAQLSNGYRQGSPVDACLNMKPKHGVEGYDEENTGKFEIDLGDAKEYSPSQPQISVPVSISSSLKTKFKGFLVKAKKLGPGELYARGTMNGPQTLSKIICGTTGNGMTHTGLFSNNWKEEISLSWSPPEDVCEALKMGDIRFEATVVRSYNDQPQINIYSKVLKMRNDTSPAEIQRCANRRNGGLKSAYSWLTIFSTVLWTVAMVQVSLSDYIQL